jgi:hypothetical protein|tara:strand:+ start:299 stop:1759 length:1461 start_codon:yes stop_codon:yes gene_type:complete
MIKNGPRTHEEWLDTGRIIIPCVNKKSVIPKWSDPEFKISKQEWQDHHIGKQIAIRLDNDTDFDIDNPRVKYFVHDHLKYRGAVFGRKNNTQSHYIFKGAIKSKKYILPNDLKQYCEKDAHGATLCEIRSGIKEYTVVPESQYHLGKELIEWENYESISEYPDDLTQDIGRIALQSALCILYPTTGSRDAYCTAIAGVLLKHSTWTPEQIDYFVHRIAIEAKDDEANLRNKKGTSHNKTNRKFGMTKISEIVQCSVKSIAFLFQWIGIGYQTVEGSSAIGEITEYAKDRYEVKIYGTKNGEAIEKIVLIDGPTLMNQKLFYETVIQQAQIWIPKMKTMDFETIVKNKFEERIRSKNYIEGDGEHEVFIKYFRQYIESKTAFTDKKNLLDFGLPVFDLEKNYLDFKLDSFEDYLEARRIKIQRVDLKKKCEVILKAKKVKGKILKHSCVFFRIADYEIEKENLTIDVQPEEGKEVKQIDFEADARQD